MKRNKEHLVGKVKIPWRTIVGDDQADSPYANLSGIETFEDGEKTSHIEVKIPQLPRECKQDLFEVVLSNPSSDVVQVDDNEKCSVVVKNNIGLCLIIVLLYFMLQQKVILLHTVLV